eukprot:gene24001-9572_t
MFGSNSPRLKVLLQARSSDMWDHLGRYSTYRSFQTYRSKSSNMDRHFVSEATLQRVLLRDEPVIMLVQVEVSDLLQLTSAVKAMDPATLPDALSISLLEEAETVLSTSTMKEAVPGFAEDIPMKAIVRPALPLYPDAKQLGNLIDSMGQKQIDAAGVSQLAISNVLSWNESSRISSDIASCSGDPESSMSLFKADCVLNILEAPASGSSRRESFVLETRNSLAGQPNKSRISMDECRAQGAVAPKLTYGEPSLLGELCSDLTAAHEILLEESKREQLDQRNEVLEAELERALEGYAPKSAILDSVNLYEPLNLGEQIESTTLDKDVKTALGAMLGQVSSKRLNPCLTPSSSSQITSLENFPANPLPKSNSNSGDKCSAGNESVMDVQTALTCIFSESAFPVGGETESLLSSGSGSHLGSPPSGLELRKPSYTSQRPGLLMKRKSDELVSEASASSSASDRNVLIVAPPVDELETLMGNACSSWQFDAFNLNALTNGRPLSAMGYFVLHTSGLIQEFKLNSPFLIKFLLKVEQGYNDNPYHSRIHATDVLQKYFVILTKGGLVPGYADRLTLLGCLLGAIVHDYQHTGLTNDFLVNSSDHLAIRYNDRTPMEHHHVAAVFGLLQRADYNFMSEMQKSAQCTLRK